MLLCFTVHFSLLCLYSLSSLCSVAVISIVTGSRASQLAADKRNKENRKRPSEAIRVAPAPAPCFSSLVRPLVCKASALRPRREVSDRCNKKQLIGNCNEMLPCCSGGRYTRDTRWSILIVLFSLTRLFGCSCFDSVARMS